MPFLRTVSGCWRWWCRVRGGVGGQRKPLQWAGWELGPSSREQRAGADGGPAGLPRVSPSLWSCSLSLSYASEEES